MGIMPFTSQVFCQVKDNLNQVPQKQKLKPRIHGQVTYEENAPRESSKGVEEAGQKGEEVK